MEAPSSSEIFRLVWRGWFAGLLVIFLPFWLLAMVAFFVSGNWQDALTGLLGVLIIPLIAAGQGLLIGGLVVLGLRVWPRKQARKAIQ